MNSNEWKEVRLDEIGKIVGGATPSTKNEAYYGGDISWVTPKDLSNHSERYIFKGERMLTQSGLEAASTRLMPSNSVLFSSRAPIGYVAIAGMELCTNQGFKSIIPKEGICDSMFLYYLLKYKKQDIEAVASGTTFMEVSGATMKNFKVIIPTINEQKAIAGTLSCIDDKIELNNRINKNLELMTQTTFKSWFIDFEPFKDGIFEDSELGLIPEGWRIVELGELVNIANGYSYKGSELKESQDALMTIKNFDRNGGFKIDGFKELEISGKVKESQFVELFDVLIACTDLTQNAEIIGNPILVLTKSKYRNLIASMDLVKVIPKTERINNFVLYTLMRNEKFKQFALGYSSGTTVLHMNKKAITEYKIALPGDDNILKELSDIIEPMFRLISENISENMALINIRDSLLPKLMNGEVRVPVREGE